MRCAPDRKLSISRQRGYWLRCFLGSMQSARKILVAAAIILATTTAAHAQLEAPAPFHLSHLRGVFVDAKGNPIPGAAVTLNRDDKVVGSTTTDRAGNFEIKHVTCRCWLHIHKKGYSPVSREVLVGVEALTYLHNSTLYVIAGPVACSDDCSSVFTSKSKFDQAIRKNTRHYD